ncbi:MAG TPA: sialidase family protein, partial [Pyrinomonadaceae bacterium]|nr:sialidase family protein [Pyrinomonadaceae bacterium]
MFRRSTIRSAVTVSQWSLSLRFSLVLAICALALISFANFSPSSFSATPASGTVSESNPTVTWTGAVMPANPDLLNSPRCAGASASACDNYGINVVPPSAAYGPYVVEIRLQPQGDWDMEIYNPNGTYRTSSGNGVFATEVVTLYNPPAGVYRIAAFPFAPVVGSDGNSYAASAELKHQPPSGSSPAGSENVNYATFACPPGQTCTSSFGEPSIGANWNTGSVMFAGGGSLQTFRVNFNDQTSPTTATWTDVSGNQHIATSPRAFADPILFTDPRTGRTFADQLEGLTPFSTMEYTDDDGNLFVPSQGSGIASGIDHQTIGGGPLAAPLTRDPSLPRPAYPNGVYYCAQTTGPANCALSLDGGETFGPAVPIWTTECGGLHGHVKVAPNDGTVYVPNKGCGGRQGIAVSTDNGESWAIRTIPGTGTGESDPSVGVATDGTVYFGFVDGDGHPKVAVTRDKGLNWDTLGGANFIDVGIPFNIQNAVFSAVVAGDPQRAAFAFHGSPTAGPFQDSSFNGVWDLYVAHTYDGGATWTTRKATSDPTQRGCIWLGGGDNPCRNLLDFMDATIDQQGRVIVGYADGCTGACASDPNNTAKSVWATIARQSDGKRMFSAYDSNGTPTPTPTVTPTPTPSGGLYYLHGTAADEANKKQELTDPSYRGTATFDQTAPAGTVPITQTSQPVANQDFVGNSLAAYWRSPFHGT